MEDIKQEDLRLLSHGELVFLGLQKIAYIKPFEEAGKNVFGVYAADGTELAVANDWHEAKALIVKNDMYQASVH